MNVSELIQMNQLLLEEPTFDRFSEPEHILWLNRAVEDIALKTGYFRRSSVVALADGKNEISFPSGASAIIQVIYNNKPLDLTSTKQLDLDEEDWRIREGAPEEWFLQKHMLVGIYPIADAEYSLGLFYVGIDDVLADDDDTPNFPTAFHMALCYFAAREMLSADAPERAAYCGGKYKELIMQLIAVKRREENVKATPLIKPAIFD